MTQKKIRSGDAWISVVDDQTQVIIENNKDIPAALEKYYGIGEG